MRRLGEDKEQAGEDVQNVKVVERGQCVRRLIEKRRERNLVGQT